MSVQISIDQASFDRVQMQLDALKKETHRSALGALAKVAMAIRNFASLRIRERKHIVTSRLRNSLYIKFGFTPPVKVGDNETNYEYDVIKKEGGKSIKIGTAIAERSLESASVGSEDVAIGTNVSYGTKIELMDSYLYWAFKNVDVEQSLTKVTKENLAQYLAQFSK